MITSSQNPRVKELVKISQSSKERREKGLFLVEGRKMVEEAAREGVLHAVYYAESFYKEDSSGFVGEGVGVTCEVLKDAVFQHAAMTVTPQGVMGLVKTSRYAWGDVVGKATTRLLALDHVSDPGNVGTMVRTAEAAGFQGIVMSKDTADAYNPKTVRATMGSIYRMPLLYAEDWARALDRLKGDGFTLYAADLRGSEDYDEVAFDDKTAIIIGNEANGIRDETREAARRFLRVPMAGRVESLNASIAAALLMFGARVG